MLLTVFSVFDSKARAFLPPFFMGNVDVAKRVFGECANSSTHQFGRYPEDFCLFELGHFDDATGAFVLHQNPSNHGLAALYKVASPQLTSPEVCDE